MPTVNGPDEITDLEAGNDKVFYSDNNGDVTEVALGAAATVLTSSGATSAPTFSAIPADPTVGANKAMYTNNSDVESGLAFGAAGTVLTSGGTDATANPPTWETPAGGDTLSFTANGSITAGNAAVLDADGKASAAANTLAGNAIGSFTEWQTTGWHSAYGNFTVYDRNNSDHHLILGQNYQGSPPYYQGMASKVVQSNSSDTSAVFSSIVWNSVNVDNNGFDTLNAWYDDTANVCLVARRSGSNAMPYIQAATTSGTGAAASITWGTDTQINATWASYGGCGLYIPDLGYSLYFYGQAGGGTSDGLMYNTITPSGTGSPTIGTQQRIYTSALSATTAGIAASYDDTNNVIAVIFKDNTSLTNMMYIVGTVSGGAITWGTAASLTTLGSNDSSCVLSYRSSDSKWFAMWSHQSSNETMTCCGTWTSGTTISWSVKEWTSADGAIYKINYPMMEMRDDGLARASVFGRDYTGGVDRTYVFSFALSSGDYILNLTDYPQMPNNASGTSGSTQFGLSYSPDTGKYVANQWSWADPSDAGIYQPPSGSTTAANMIGAAQTTVADGETVTVKSIGTTTSVGLSGLTIRDKVYVQGDGTISGTSSAEQIGVAVAADTVLITKIGTNLT